VLRVCSSRETRAFEDFVLDSLVHDRSSLELVPWKASFWASLANRTHPAPVAYLTIIAVAVGGYTSNWTLRDTDNAHPANFPKRIQGILLYYSIRGTSQPIIIIFVLGIGALDACGCSIVDKESPRVQRHLVTITWDVLEQ
jgi:hypothetical protein